METLRMHPVSFLPCVLAIGLSAAEPVSVTPAQWLKAQSKPAFKPGHTLPPLIRYGWVLPLDARIELAEHWGYCLEYGHCGATAEAIAGKLADPTSAEAQVVALVARDPVTYRLSVICPRSMPAHMPAEAWTRNAAGNFLDGKGNAIDGTAWHKDMPTVLSPAAPDSMWMEAARIRAEPIGEIRKHCPITIIYNEGESGLGVLGFARTVWEQDPAILAAKKERTWPEYISEQKAQAELRTTQALKAAAPGLLHYIQYNIGGSVHRSAATDWGDWGYGYEWMQPVSDLPSTEHYYRHFNTGWTGPKDLLTLALAAKGFEIASGQPLSYNCISGGWPRETGLGSPEPLADGGLPDIACYTGFLTCLGTAGMIGARAGYPMYPPGGFAAPFPADAPPHWLLQMEATARVQARLSHVEPFLRQGDLLPGPHANQIYPDQPACEFPTGDPEARVLVRRMRNRPEWLITAWAAGGADRPVTVNIPELGAVTVQAQVHAGVCTATLEQGKPVLHPLP